MTQLKTATAAILLALAAACVPVEKTPYAGAQKPAALTVAYPDMAKNALADGQVYEYH
jgi:hypothetical protein